MKAVIDIGSNSVRLLMDCGAPVNTKKLNTTQLSLGLAKTGRLSEDAIVRTAKAVTDFFAEAANNGAEKIYIFGTEAMRNPGGQDLKKLIERQIPVCVDIVSGEQEATLGFVGAAGTKGKIAVIDIGGASVEAVEGVDGVITHAQSLPLGVVRVRDITGDDRTSIERYYREHIKEYGKLSADALMAIGGTATSLASMLLDQKEYDATAIHGYRITRSVLACLIDRIFDSDDVCRDFPTIGVKRAGVIAHGAILLLLLMEYFGFDSLTVSERDNMEGYLQLHNITSND